MACDRAIQQKRGERQNSHMVKSHHRNVAQELRGLGTSCLCGEAGARRWCPDARAPLGTFFPWDLRPGP